MGEYTTVTCDGSDCYKTIDDCSSSEAHEDSGYGFSERPGWVTAFKKVPWKEAFPMSTSDDHGWTTDVWKTWCRDCALNIDLEDLRSSGWDVKTPEGFVEGVFCPDCKNMNCPGYIDNGKKPWTGSGKTFKMNPSYKQEPCKRCDKTGYLKEPVADTRDKTRRW